MTTSPCCPAGAEPLRLFQHLDPRGEMADIGGIPCYVARSPSPTTRAILIFTDIFGVNSGRHRQLCDELAAEGFLVVCPDLFGEDILIRERSPFGLGLGDILKFIGSFIFGRLRRWGARHSWAGQLQPAVADKLLPWIKEQGVTRTATLGFCWGAYPVFKCCSIQDAFACGVSFHPSVENTAKDAKEDDLQICREVKCPQMVVATAMEGAKWKPGGAAETATKEAAPATTWTLETDANHGFMTRGDPADAKTRGAVERGWSSLLGFLNQHVPA